MAAMTIFLGFFCGKTSLGVPFNDTDNGSVVLFLTYKHDALEETLKEYGLM